MSVSSQWLATVLLGSILGATSGSFSESSRLLVTATDSGAVRGVMDGAGIYAAKAACARISELVGRVRTAVFRIPYSGESPYSGDGRQFTYYLSQMKIINSCTCAHIDFVLNFPTRRIQLQRVDTTCGGQSQICQMSRTWSRNESQPFCARRLAELAARLP